MMSAQRNDTVSRLTRGLSLAAAPAFAAMAVVSAMRGEGSMVCMQDTGPLDGMTLMYALMSLFHLAPWLGRFSAHAAFESRQTCHSHPSPTGK